MNEVNRIMDKTDPNPRLHGAYVQAELQDLNVTDSDTTQGDPQKSQV